MKFISYLIGNEQHWIEYCQRSLSVTVFRSHVTSGAMPQPLSLYVTNFHSLDASPMLSLKESELCGYRLKDVP
ncbi:hypothetical protein L6452_18682 [Arctium lappa]|uniref:Uncharacterized protein n=1 Tax=Arctium lappa TaxID=4217 RepID=A0ACB9C6R6_ARCLA|nr:hypothetical protein L6452_18682 [Arctium lappa]